MTFSEPYESDALEDFLKGLRKEQRPEAYFVAVCGDEYVGKASFYPDEGRSFLFTQLTGVKPQCRRKGIALALKVRAILYAKANGYATLQTENRADNVAMLALNERLGFVREPANIGFEKVLKEESA
jgi:GNAT superfamily N-acetyltransferase